MSGDFFDRLDADLAELTRHGAHLTLAERARRRWGRVARRGAVGALVAVALAASLASEFPGTASGRDRVAQAVQAERL
jgi:hypothetical protein